MAQFISDCIAAEQLRNVYPWIGALQRKWLIEAGVLKPSLFGADASFPPNVAIEAAIDAFLRAYGTSDPAMKD